MQKRNRLRGRHLALKTTTGKARQRRKRIEEVITYAWNHRTRVHILIVLNEGTYTPAEIAAIIDEPLSNVSNHIRELLESGSIELAKTEKVRNATQHYYRAVETPYFSDEEMALQYAKADIVLFPSTFEGFGLPFIEAQTAGRVVITSDLSPMKEVAGNGALLIDPYDPAAIRAAVLRVSGDAACRADLIEKGLDNCKKYSSGIIASRYAEVYEQIMQPTHVRNSRDY